MFCEFRCFPAILGLLVLFYFLRALHISLDIFLFCTPDTRRSSSFSPAIVFSNFFIYLFFILKRPAVGVPTYRRDFCLFSDMVVTLRDSFREFSFLVLQMHCNLSFNASVPTHRVFAISKRSTSSLKISYKAHPWGGNGLHSALNWALLGSQLFQSNVINTTTIAGICLGGGVSHAGPTPLFMIFGEGLAMGSGPTIVLFPPLTIWFLFLTFLHTAYMP